MPWEDDKFGMEFTHPAWKEGRRAYRRGKLISDNPYPVGTVECEAWEQGWHEAMSGQELPENEHG